MQVGSTQSHPVISPDNKQPPAQAARDLLNTRTDLADQPFGKLVSLFARKLDVPPPASNSSG